jgi:hypothetical protein
MKEITWYVKSRKKMHTFIGVDKADGFVSRKWIDNKGDRCYNFYDVRDKHPRTAVNYFERNI